MEELALLLRINSNPDQGLQRTLWGISRRSFLTQGSEDLHF